MLPYLISELGEVNRGRRKAVACHVSGVIFPRIHMEKPLDGQHHEALSQNVQIFYPTIAISGAGFFSVQWANERNSPRINWKIDGLGGAASVIAVI